MEATASNTSQEQPTNENQLNQNGEILKINQNLQEETKQQEELDAKKKALEERKAELEKELNERVKQRFIQDTNNKLLTDLERELTESEFAEVKKIVELCKTVEDMSTKSRVSDSKICRPTKPTDNSIAISKQTSELRGQPTNKISDEQIWREREKQLLYKIEQLEKKVRSSTEEEPSDAVVQQRELELRQDVQIRTQEKEEYMNKLANIEKQLKSIDREQSPSHTSDTIEVLRHQNDELKNALTKMTSLLREKTGLCSSQEKKVVALSEQVTSLKEVVAITKDLLNIRNMEVNHLTGDICKMEAKIDAERERHNTMISKMDEAVKLNSQLKKEYESQLRLFQKLRDKYEEKVEKLQHEEDAMSGMIAAGEYSTKTRSRSRSPTK